MTKIIALEWNEKKKKFIDESGLEVMVQNVGIPKQYHDVEASAGSPLCYKIPDYVQRAARGTNANAYRCTSIETEDSSEYRSSYTLIIELYRILHR